MRNNYALLYKRILSVVFVAVFLVSGACAKPPEPQSASISDKTVFYDGNEHYIEAVVPDGATVTYSISGEEGNYAVEIGEYDIVAAVTFSDKSTKKYLATLKIIENPDLPKYDTPDGLSFGYDGIIRWSEVEDAFEYTLTLNGEEYSVRKNYFDIRNFESGEYSVSVKVNRSAKKRASDVSSVFSFDFNAYNDPDFVSKYVTFTKNIPTIHIDTQGGAPIVSRDYYLNAVADIESEIAGFSLDGLNLEIRGRGNSSWDNAAKKSYRLKFNSKTSIFGRPAVKNWALIASYADKSFMRNYYAYMLGRSLESFSFTPTVIYCSLILNGSYQGLYCLTDQMETGPSRLDVEGYTVDGNGNLTDCGFLVEQSFRCAEEGLILDRDYFNAGGKSYEIKYPKYDDDGFLNNPILHSQAVNFMRSYISNVYSRISGSNYQGFLEICDERTFIDYFIVQELMKNVDGHQLSVFSCKAVGGKMEMGPLWDFDIAAGNANYVGDIEKPTGWYINGRHPWLTNLLKVPAFRSNFKARYNDLYENQIADSIAVIDGIAGDISAETERNFSRWNILGVYVWPNPNVVIAANTYEKQVAFLKSFLSDRAAWIYTNL